MVSTIRTPGRGRRGIDLARFERWQLRGVALLLSLVWPRSPEVLATEGLNHGGVALADRVE
jgi:hypothetical protein